ncbi:MAG TPA: MoxR family ATPase [Acidimicrobiia bacterium]
MSGEFSAAFEQLVDNLERVIRGKRAVLEQVVICLLAEGHLLIEDVPGVGKTSIARALAASIEGSWKRIQFTPDLLPSDVTGITIYNQTEHEFEFHPGGVFANIVVADEINRASPKTQSALLEVMEERRVTVDSHPHVVPRPFMVIATQNPIEMDGTYRLPEAQLDRFLMRLAVGYPDARSEREIMNGYHDGAAIDALAAVLTTARISGMIAAAGEVYVAEELQDYIVQLTATTRNTDDVRLGASPRGSLALLRAARARALADGRNYVLPEDIKELAVTVLAHRIIIEPEAELRGVSSTDVISQVLAAVPVPQVTAA